jgi:HlyD family secretion protein
MKKILSRLISKVISFLFKHKWAVVIVLTLMILSKTVVIPKTKAAIEGPAAKYETAAVKKETIVSSVSASGKIEAETQVTLKFQASGKLVWVGVKKGDQVKKWQAIASLDKRELESDLKKELNDYLKERWDFEQTQDDYKQTKENKLITDEIQRILDKAQYDLNNSVVDYEIANLALELATITSPIDGIVTDLDSPVAGVNITPTTATFVIADPEVMIFKAKVDEADIGKVKEGQKVILILDAYEDQEFEGKVDKIEFSSTSTSSGGTAYVAQIKLPENDQLRFKIGMNGDAQIITDERTDVLAVPVEAIKEEADHEYVEVIDGKQIQKVTVETGISNDTQTEILSGLTENQKVVTGKKKQSS